MLKEAFIGQSHLCYQASSPFIALENFVIKHKLIKRPAKSQKTDVKTVLHRCYVFVCACLYCFTTPAEACTPEASKTRTRREKQEMRGQSQ